MSLVSRLTVELWERRDEEGPDGSASADGDGGVEPLAS